MATGGRVRGGGARVPFLVTLWCLTHHNVTENDPPRADSRPHRQPAPDT